MDLIAASSSPAILLSLGSITSKDLVFSYSLLITVKDSVVLPLFLEMTSKLSESSSSEGSASSISSADSSSSVAQSSLSPSSLASASAFFFLLFSSSYLAHMAGTLAGRSR